MFFLWCLIFKNELSAVMTVFHSGKGWAITARWYILTVDIHVSGSPKRNGAKIQTLLPFLGADEAQPFPVDPADLAY